MSARSMERESVVVSRKEDCCSEFRAGSSRMVLQVTCCWGVWRVWGLNTPPGPADCSGEMVWPGSGQLVSAQDVQGLLAGVQLLLGSRPPPVRPEGMRVEVG